MKVIIIIEESHGFIGCAKDYKSSIRFLIKENWLVDVDIWDEERHIWRSHIEILGENWANIIENQWNIEKFNEFFQESFYLYEEKVYED